MNSTWPIGEEIWIRRDLESRGGSFYYREILLFSILSSSFLILLLGIPMSIALFQSGTVPLLIAMILFVIIVLIPFGISFIAATKHLHAMSCLCPLWLYAEQLNPETLTIHHLRKPSTQLQLAESTLQERTFLKHYTTITLTDKDKNSATLPALTPEETDRFMAYWNAANPDSAHQNTSPLS